MQRLSPLFDPVNKCAICLDPYLLNPENKCLQLSCNHIYHLQCITDWFAQHNSCPTCRAQSEVDSDQLNFYMNFRPRLEVLKALGIGGLVFFAGFKWIQMTSNVEDAKNCFPLPCLDSNQRIPKFASYAKVMYVFSLIVLIFFAIIVIPLLVLIVKRRKNPPVLPENVIIFKPIIQNSRS